MNTEIIRGNALQVLELVEEVKRLTNEMGCAQYDKQQKDNRIGELEKEKEELNKRCERLNADSMAYCNYGKKIEKDKNNEIKAIKEEMGRLTANLADTQSALLQHRIMIEEAKRFVDSEKKKCAESIESEKQASIEEKKKLQQEMQRLIEAAKKSQEEESFMTQKCIAAMKEVTRLKGLLARNGIKYKKVK